MIHRPRCDEPPPDERPSTALPDMTIRRCPTCGAVELHRPEENAR